MRDIAIVSFIFAMVPVMIKKPWIGVMMWVWISVMTPHAFGWGFAPQFRVALVAGIATLIGLVVTRDRVKFPLNGTTVLLIVFSLWMTVTLIYAFRFTAALGRWEEVMKMLTFVFVVASVLHTRKHVEVLLWVIVFSVGFYGVKGGIFTILTGGNFKVWGPPGTSYITDNNSISVALIMIIPLAHYLALHSERKIVRFALYSGIALSIVAVLGSQSRGAFLAVVVMSGFLWIKNRQKIVLGLFAVALLPIAITFMPEAWKDRMRTVQTYEEDTSAVGRINAWHAAFNIANDRPFGGGFELYSPEMFERYAPDPTDVHSAHSIYFQILGEHGWVGLALFLSLGINAWVNSRRIIRFARAKPELSWAADLSRAIQVSLIGFAVGGAFVNIAYWEIQYYELVILMIIWNLVRNPTLSGGMPTVSAATGQGRVHA
jgi:probable O-glycosylation ligase (exosortase A-associated)